MTKNLKRRTPAQRRAAFKLGARNAAPVSDGHQVREPAGPSALRALGLSAESPIPAALPPLPIVGPLAQADPLPTIAPLGHGPALVEALRRFSAPLAVLGPLGAADA